LAAHRGKKELKTMNVAQIEPGYNELGGVYFPILQQDGKTRITIKINNGDKPTDIVFLGWLRQHDRD
jgi:hypothetical protein